VLNLLALHVNTNVAPVGDDNIIWPHDSKGKFTIKSFYKEVCVGSSNLAFPGDAIQRSKAPTKACFLAYATAMREVPIEDMLKRRNFNLTGRCPMCLQEKKIDRPPFCLL